MGDSQILGRSLEIRKFIQSHLIEIDGLIDLAFPDQEISRQEFESGRRFLVDGVVDQIQGRIGVVFGEALDGLRPLSLSLFESLGAPSSSQ